MELFSPIIKLTILLVSIIVYPYMLLGQEVERTKLLTPGVGLEYGIGDKGHGDVRLEMRINTPSFEHLVWGLSVQGGFIFHDLSGKFYMQDTTLSYDDIHDWYSYSFSFYCGYEFKPYENINPYIMVGFGFWEYFYTATRDSFDMDVTSETGSFIPILAGCDIKILDFVSVTPFVRADLYLDALEEVLYPSDPLLDDFGEAPEAQNISKWRGILSIGIHVSIPLYFTRRSY